MPTEELFGSWTYVFDSKHDDEMAKIEFKFFSPQIANARSGGVADDEGFAIDSFAAPADPSDRKQVEQDAIFDQYPDRHFFKGEVTTLEPLFELSSPSKDGPVQTEALAPSDSYLI